MCKKSVLCFQKKHWNPQIEVKSPLKSQLFSFFSCQKKKWFCQKFAEPFFWKKNVECLKNNDILNFKNSSTFSQKVVKIEEQSKKKQRLL